MARWICLCVSRSFSSSWCLQSSDSYSYMLHPGLDSGHSHSRVPAIIRFHHMHPSFFKCLLSCLSLHRTQPTDLRLPFCAPISSSPASPESARPPYLAYEVIGAAE
ncbi:hypothetical protein J3F84DRAFT_380084 [Trichoderma pleuroticola]